MEPRVVLLTGVTRHLGSQLAGLLSADPSIERVIGVDTVPPRQDQLPLLGRTEFVRADIRNPLIAKVLAQSSADTVVHTNLLAGPLGAGGRTSMKEINVIGTMQLLAACQKSATVRKLVVRSTTAVYGTSPHDPALFTEDSEVRSLPRGGFAKDAVEVEGYVRGFGRRRPDVVLSLLRFANLVGPRIDTSLTRYLSLPVVPTVLGFDPRLQMCHEDDAVEVLRRSIHEDHPGIFNVGGSGVLLLSQALRRLGRASVPVPFPAVSLVGRLVRGSGLVDFSSEQLRFLEHGRVADVSRLAAELGWSPRSTEQAFASLGGEDSRAAVDAAAATVERGLVALAGRLGGRSELAPQGPSLVRPAGARA